MIDPACLTHGKLKSTHFCVQCALCHRDLTLDECAEDDKGEIWDICDACYRREQDAIKLRRLATAFTVFGGIVWLLVILAFAAIMVWL